MTDATLRPMRRSDAQAVAALTTELGYAVEADEQAARIEAVLAYPETGVALVAVNEHDTAVGWIHVERLRLLELSDTAQVSGLVVADGRRSGGIGAELLQAAEAWATDRGCRVMLVRSRVSRERAHRFYERHGYGLLKVSNVYEKPLG